MEQTTNKRTVSRAALTIYTLMDTEAIDIYHDIEFACFA
jgi:hypothetical protein